MDVTTPIPRRKAVNQTTERLQARRAELLDLIRGRSGDVVSRHEFAMRAYELHAIEDALTLRDQLAPSLRYTNVVSPTGIDTSVTPEGSR